MPVGEGLGQRFGLARRPDGASGRCIDKALSLEIAQERPQTGEVTPKGPGTRSIPSPLCQKSAEIGCAQSMNLGEARWVAEMDGQELEELTCIPLIGRQRVFREAFLVGEAVQPLPPMVQKFGRRQNEDLVHRRSVCVRHWLAESQLSITI